MSEYVPLFDVKLQGHAIATYKGPTDAASMGKLWDYLRKQGWRGQLVCNFPGNGGIQNVIFTEVRRAKEVLDTKS